MPCTAHTLKLHVQLIGLAFGQFARLPCTHDAGARVDHTNTHTGAVIATLKYPGVEDANVSTIDVCVCDGCAKFLIVRFRLASGSGRGVFARRTHEVAVARGGESRDDASGILHYRVL